MSNIVNKVKDALSSDKTHQAPQGTHGPHGSRVANTADPRVDSDRDHRGDPTTTHGTTGGLGSTGTHTGTHAGTHAGTTGGLGSTGTHGTTGGLGSTGTHAGTGVGTTGAYSSGGAPEGTHGPHGSGIANAADPRVDSDRDHRAAPGTHGIGSTGAHTGTHTTHGTTGGLGSTGTHTGGLGGDGTHTTGVGSTGAYGTNAPGGTHGPHGSRVANVADPRVDSNRDHRAAPDSSTLGSSTATHTGTHTTGSHGGVGTHLATGTGPAPNTAGPHKSDLLNKADPRVDSDLDGSKTVGGNKTGY